MLSFTGSLKVFLVLGATDLHRSFDGLYAQAPEVMMERPESGKKNCLFFGIERRIRIDSHAGLLYAYATPTEALPAKP